MTPDQDGVFEPNPIIIEEEIMAENAVAEAANIQTALTGMMNETGAASARRMGSADQLSGDSQRMWTIAMTTPTQFAALAQRVVGEAGSGRTRAETNNPGNTAAPGGG